MDELELELLLLDFQEEIEEYNKNQKNELGTKPRWWNIKHGLIESTPEEYEGAVKIFREFMKFKEKEGETIFQRFTRFEQFKLFNNQARL